MMKIDRPINKTKYQFIYLIFMFIHVVISWFIFINGAPKGLNKLLDMTINTFQAAGFSWDFDRVRACVAVLFLSLILNVCRCFWVSVFYRWSIFLDHDKISFVHSITRLVAYLLFIFFVVGALIQNYASNYKISSLMSFLIFSVGVFFIGYIIDVINDALAATYVCFFKGK
ncbi:hypothetical protein QN416_07495 [Glaciimonas sp. Cout2]|uniref:hypothetical protein n=2 Tax=unclassified Glaciimonas TaxID=2644401 RepID=UPI002B22566B|nr:hypothetical protein [Glaciimonas sp. Cout2]MEB0011467.1 hypothetical protein [Glaciimonas sp. Cout2]